MNTMFDDTYSKQVHSSYENQKHVHYIILTFFNYFFFLFFR